METTHLGLFLMLCLGAGAASSETLKRQKRNWIIDSFTINEGYSGVFPYVLDTIEVQKKFTIFKISGQGVDLDPKGLLEINKITGQVKVNRAIDYEEYQVLKLDFQALDQESDVVDTQLGIEILIIDANDNTPLFEHTVYHFNLMEATLQGTEELKVMATDKDRTKKFNTFDLRIVSVHPKPFDLEFFLIQHFQVGTISFKGCLDHEKADKYTIIVEAKDHGEEKQLSSSCTVIVHIEDGNNHIPVITGQTGSGRVKEGEQNVLVNRLQVKDNDSRGSAAWMARYQIQGNSYFRITTDRETNEGLLYVTKVKHRSATGLWDVTIGGRETVAVRHHQVTVTVEDANEPPFFDPPKKQVTQSESVEVGNYIKGDDPANWVAVDRKTGKITTANLIDRESTFVKNNVYPVTVLAVDDGQPPMTGTATLEIHITDENDNVPTLSRSVVDVCQSDGVSLANITVEDYDEEPYGGPFIFRLPDQEKGRWKLDPAQGFSVNLVKEPAVHSGQYELLLEVMDLQGMTATHNLLVTVCVLLLAFLVSCKKRSKEVIDDDTHQHLMQSNIEQPGTDCQVLTITQEYSQMPAALPKALAVNQSPISSPTDVSFIRGNSVRQSLNRRSTYSSNQEIAMHETMLLNALNKAVGEELGDYAPRVYAEEGVEGSDFELDAISIPTVPFDPEVDAYLAPKFYTLTSICMPGGQGIPSPITYEGVSESPGWTRHTHMSF
ncbi:Cadherin-2 [Liparis tanakae]|uniref:Cadherin-2 n=1 Tax=Liparis tanakae TaxID=230148 RepID=A0A4Z2FPQ0_9TELE|nr:Cadherin-2 [Liparis tanakae]